MINLFDFASDDKSLQYLAQIFGYVNGVIPIPTAGTSAPRPLPSGVSLSLLGTMFQVFNSTILAVGALIVIYATVVGVMATAHEGEFLGKKWHSLWAPLRTVLGIAALFPTGSGYSGIQIIMMWVIVQGIGAADTLWNTSLAYIGLMGSPYAVPTLPSTGVSQTMNDLFQGLVCDATFREGAKNPDSLTNNGYYYCNQTRDAAFCGSTNAFDGADKTKTTYSMGPGGACGTLTYCNQTEACADRTNVQAQLKCEACTAQVAALDQAINGTLIPIATYFEQTDYSFRNFWFNNDPSVPNAGGTVGFESGWLNKYCTDNGLPGGKDKCCVPGTPGCDPKVTQNPFNAFSVYDDQQKSFGANNVTVKNLYWDYSIKPKFGPTNFVDTVTGQYMNTLSGSVTQFMTAHAKDIPLTEKLTEARNYGWIMAGGYYYYLGSVNSSNLQNALPKLGYTSNNPEQNATYSNARINYGAAKVLKDMMREAGTTETGGAQKSTEVGSSSSTGDVTKVGTNTINDMYATFQDSTKPSLQFNPLAQLQMAGTIILLIAQIAYVVVLAVTLAVGILSGLNGFALGNLMVNPMSTGMIMVYFILMPALMALFGIMITVGGMLGIYLPLIPFIIFSFGAIGWMISTIEAMVAGPLVALGILSPGGHHEILGKAEPALLLLFNVFLRPSLMIFGLIASLLLASVVILMINTAFWSPVMIGILGGKGQDVGVVGSPLAFLIFLVAYVLLIVSAMNKCFEAIHIIPERVMRWIGGQGEQYGESAAVGEAKRGTEAGAAGGVRAGEAGGAAAQKKVEAVQSAKLSKQAPGSGNPPAGSGKGET